MHVVHSHRFLCSWKREHVKTLSFCQAACKITPAMYRYSRRRYDWLCRKYGTGVVDITNIEQFGSIHKQNYSY